MFKSCVNCKGMVFKGIETERGLVCSAECRDFTAHPGFCAQCTAISTEKSSGGTWVVNGIGTRLYGSKDRCPTCGAVSQTHWITFLYLPVIPLGKYRVKKVSPSSFLSRKLAA
jgi:hypothetical protein